MASIPSISIRSSTMPRSLRPAIVTADQAVPEYGAGTGAALQARTTSGNCARTGGDRLRHAASQQPLRVCRRRDGNNTALKTQTNLGYDLGVDWTPNNAVKLSATGFYEFFRDELVTQATTNRHAQSRATPSMRRGRSIAVSNSPPTGASFRAGIHGGLHLSRRILHRIHREPIGAASASTAPATRSPAFRRTS